MAHIIKPIRDRIYRAAYKDEFSEYDDFNCLVDKPYGQYRRRRKQPKKKK